MFVTVRSALAGLVFLCAGSAQAALVSSYDFDSGMADTLGAGPALIASGGTIAAGRYVFGDNQGLALSGGLPSASAYALEIGFRVNAGEDVSSYAKLLDFKNRSSDAGLYIYQNALRLYGTGGQGGTVTAGTDLFLGFVRAGNAVSVYLGTTPLSGSSTPVVTLANDGGWADPTSDILHFFRDDSSVSGETFAGSVDFIRVHDDASTFGQSPLVQQPAAVPLPAGLPLLAAGLGAFGLLGARRRG